MNISFFLKPKNEVIYLYEDTSVREAIDEMLEHRFTAIPVISHSGRYVGTICEGDFLRVVRYGTSKQIDCMRVAEVPRRFLHQTVSVDARMEDMISLVTEQNFVPVTDGRGMFIGIITRRDVLQHVEAEYRLFLSQQKKEHKKAIAI